MEVYKNGDAWASRDVIRLGNYAGGGYIGMWLVNAADTVLENFGGGDVVIDAANPTLAHFVYQVNKLGNRTQALEVLAQPETATDTIVAYDDKGLVLTGSWSVVSSFQESTDTEAVLKLLFLAKKRRLTMGKGPDHSIYDLYLDGEFWQSVDGYAVSPDQEDIAITSVTLLDEGPHTLEIRNQNSKNASSSDYKVRFNQLLVEDKTWTLHTIEYNYDALYGCWKPATIRGSMLMPSTMICCAATNMPMISRAIAWKRPSRSMAECQQRRATATTRPTRLTLWVMSTMKTATWLRWYKHLYLGSSQSSGEWDKCGSLSYRLRLRWPGQPHLAVGRHDQPTVTQYLLDLQPGWLSSWRKPLDTNITRNVHTPPGIHAHKDASGAWEWMVQDGLGSVREVVG